MILSKSASISLEDIWCLDQIASAVANEIEASGLLHKTMLLLFDFCKLGVEKEELTENTLAEQSQKSIPSHSEIGKVLHKEKEALVFLENEKVVKPPGNCPNCNGHLTPMSKSLKSNSQIVVWRCKRKCQGWSCSILRSSIVATCRLNKAKFVDLVCHWLINAKASEIKTALSCLGKTTTNWTNHLQEAVACDLLTNDECMIGGPGMCIETDESKFGMRKCNVSVNPLGCFAREPHVSHPH